ncbi:hypothetical protein ACIGO9_20050 [Nocardia asteroides]|uniref:hypothetical protein n=1 Tax=Nocardia asteroides TaxID=1824 RepID=UPI0037C5A588
MSIRQPILTTSALYPTWRSTSWTRVGPRARPLEHNLEQLPIIEWVHHALDPVGYCLWPPNNTADRPAASKWRLTTVSEVRFTGIDVALTASLDLRESRPDTRCGIERSLGKVTEPGGGRWWTLGHEDVVRHRMIVLLRRGPAIDGPTFGRFVRETLSPAFHRGGARDLRSYAFLPITMPDESREVGWNYQGAIIFGADSRVRLHDVLMSHPVSAAIRSRSHILRAAHLYSTESSTALLRNDRIMAPHAW